MKQAPSIDIFSITLKTATETYALSDCLELMEIHDPWKIWGGYIHIFNERVTEITPIAKLTSGH